MPFESWKKKYIASLHFSSSPWIINKDTFSPFRFAMVEHFHCDPGLTNLCHTRPVFLGRHQLDPANLDSPVWLHLSDFPWILLFSWLSHGLPISHIKRHTRRDIGVILPHWIAVDGPATPRRPWELRCVNENTSYLLYCHRRKIFSIQQSMYSQRKCLSHKPCAGLLFIRNVVGFRGFLFHKINDAKKIQRKPSYPIMHTYHNYMCFGMVAGACLPRWPVSHVAVFESSFSSRQTRYVNKYNRVPEMETFDSKRQPRQSHQQTRE